MLHTIGIIGRTADGTNLCDGQTVKTRVLADELRRLYPKAEIRIADTYNYKKRAVRIVRDLIVCMRDSQVVFILLSKNGRDMIFPIVNFLNRFYRKPILHDCIGGALDAHVKENGKIRDQLNKFAVNWVESEPLKARLEKLGVRHVEYLPNFKRLHALKENELPVRMEAPFHFCTFSRVNEPKGIGRAAEAVIGINQEAGRKLAYLDVYGPIEDQFDTVLDELIRRADGAIAYKGIAAYDRSVEILKNYDMLLFPTTFAGEGFPGTLIDAFSAGLPVIATNWHCNGEIITTGKTGFLYEVSEPHRLKALMEYAIGHPDEILRMRRDCLKEAKRYDADTVMATVSRKIEALAGGGQIT